MSRIDELIEQLCPDGVEYKTLGSIGKFYRGSSFQKKHFVVSGTPCIHYGQIHTRFDISTDHVVSYLDESFASKMKRASHGDLIIATTSEDDDAVGKAIAWLGEEDVVVSNDAYIYRHGQNPKYISYLFGSSLFQESKRPFITGTKVRRLSDKGMSQIRVPVPPLEIQQEIVRVLDSFAELETELETELEARHSQFDYYRNRILIDSAEGAEKVQLAKVGTFTGSTPKKSEQRFFGDEHPFYKPGDFDAGESVCTSADGLTSEGLTASRVVPQGTTMVVCIGATIGKVGYALETGSCNQQINVILPNEDFNPRYVFHLANSRIVQDQIARLGNFSSMPILSLKKFNQIEIPMPSREIQDRVANALDKFDAIVHDISDGIPAEISARHSQYAYYRDRLLAFRERVA